MDGEIVVYFVGFMQVMPVVVSQGCITGHNYRDVRLARCRLVARPFLSIWLIHEIHFAIYSLHGSSSLAPWDMCTARRWQVSTPWNRLSRSDMDPNTDTQSLSIVDQMASFMFLWLLP